MRKVISHTLAALILAVWPALLPVAAQEANQAASGVYLTEVKLGGAGEVKEYVELFNSASVTVDLSVLTLEYAKSGFAGSSCSLPDWKTAARPASLVSTTRLTGQLEPGQFKVIEMSLTDNAAGSLRLSSQTTDFVELDLLGWGEAAPCFRTAPAPLPAAGRSIKRSFAGGYLHVEAADNNAVDWVVDDTPLAGNDQCLIDTCLPAAVTEETTSAEYPDILITELLPDPASPALDSQDEFIELFNAGDQPVSLDGFTLHTASQSSSYQKTLAGVNINPGEYLALKSAVTGLSLVNGKTGYSWLTAPDGQVIDESDWYPADIAAGEVWALTQEGWQLSDTMTPGLANVITIPEETVQQTAVEAVAACPAGKYRNSDTGRCKSLGSVVAAIQACKPDQERNPETGRCRKLVQAKTAAPCAPNQQRNPETGRCRQLTTAKSTECQPGYTRNPATNRCRKQPVANATRPPDEPPGHNKLNLSLIAAASIVLLGYAVYEYRLDIVNLVNKLRKPDGGEAALADVTMTPPANEPTT